MLSLAGCASSAELVSETDGAWVNFRYSGGHSEVMYCTIKNSEGVPVCMEPRIDRIRRYYVPQGPASLRDTPPKEQEFKIPKKIQIPGE